MATEPKTVYLVRGVSDPANITEAQATVFNGKFAEVVDAEGNKEIYDSREWAETREKATERIESRKASVLKVRAKNLPEQFAKNAEKLCRMANEMREAGITVPAVQLPTVDATAPVEPAPV